MIFVENISSQLIKLHLKITIRTKPRDKRSKGCSLVGCGKDYFQAHSDLKSLNTLRKGQQRAILVVFLTVSTLSSSVARESSLNNRDYGAVSILRISIDNAKMYGDMGLNYLPQVYLVILPLVQTAAYHLCLLETTSFLVVLFLA